MKPIVGLANHVGSIGAGAGFENGGLMLQSAKVAHPVAGSEPAAPKTVARPEPVGLGCLVIVARYHGLHLSVAQLVHDNVLTKNEIAIPEIIRCATRAGLKAKAVKLDWDGLSHLRKTLPAIVILKNGNSLVLLRIEGEGDAYKLVLQDPNASEDTPLIIDQVRFKEAWTGDVILARRNYEIADEDQPFSFGLVASLVFHERRLVRDVAISAILLSFLALAPIIYWRLMGDRVVAYKAMNTFIVISLGMLAVILFEAGFAYVRRLLVLHLTTRLDVKLSTYMFEKVLNLPMDFFERTQVGKITYDMNQLNKIRSFLTGQLFGSVLDSTVLLVFLPVMFFFSPTLTAAVVTICAIIALWLLLMLPVYRRKSSAVEAAESEKGAFLVQNIYGMRTIKTLALDARQRHVWDVHVARVAKLRFTEGLTSNLIQSVVLPLERLAVTGSYALGVYFAITTNDPVYIGALFAFLMLSQRVAAPLMQMAALVNQYDEARTAVGVVANLVNQPPEEGRSGQGVRNALEGHVQFSKVTFRYKGATSRALDNVSFELPQGGKLGIMGRSGSGKTTITRLIQRLHSDYEGLIKIDGVDVREYDVDHLRRCIGVVLQENFLFSGTIRSNISAAKIDASFQEVVRAARLAGAEEFIDKLPRGYETHIYEGSPNLSGGQRQRLAIARALIINPRILILDEATSSLDAESEAIVNANISRIAHGRTLIVISHRLSSLVTSDAILVLEQGRVHDIGRHQELLQRCDIYSDLWYQQNQHVVASGTGRGKPPLRGPTLVS
jgi:ATP-binding cassette, subfamily B, bacterial HlyB/CyaB